MSKTPYSQLQQNSIRLLRLAPSEKGSDDLRCELFEYSLRNSDKLSYPYEALSYFWGSEGESKSITVNNWNINIRLNLFNALLRLRDHACSRVLWIDAICIDQDDTKDKEHQIPLMTEIYAKAYRVLVWLGEADESIGQVFESIRLAGEDPTMLPSIEQSITQLLQRPWFQRIWVLQEMAAARHITIMCGSSEIDGHAFCLGMDSLGKRFQEATSQVTFLIRGATFRSGRTLGRREGRLSLDMYSLGELADMYHTYKASIPHDKVYALLGMCSDDLSTAGLDPDYSLPWELLMQRVVKFLLGDYVSVNTCTEKQRVIIKSKGCVLGRVTGINISNGVGSRQVVEITTKSSPGYKIIQDGRWCLQTSAKSIRTGDILCLLQGAVKPAIIRAWEDHFIIIVIEPVYLEHTEGGDAEWSKLAQPASFIRDFLLFWDWETSSQNQDPGPYKALISANDLQSQHAQTESEIDMNDAIRRWHAAQILGDSKEFVEAREKRRKAAALFDAVVRREHTHSLECQCNQIPLLWAAESGESSLVDLLLITNNGNPNLEDCDGLTPLSHAAKQGHETVVKLLIETGKVEVDSKDQWSQTPLLHAAERGHETIVKLIIETGKAEADSKNQYGQTPLLRAAKQGHEAIVKLLIEMRKVDSKDNDSRTPLSHAAEQGHEAIVKLLIETGKVEVNSKDQNGQTPLLCAAKRGHKAIVKLLIDTGKVKVDSKDQYDQTPLSHAAEFGHEAIVKLLIETGKVEVDSKDLYDQTPLSRATEYGREAVVKLLIETGKVEVNSKDYDRLTPLSHAAEQGHEAIVKLLIETGKVEVNSKDNDGRTPLSRAAEQGHEAIVKMLIETGKVEVDSKDKNDKTPLSYAAEYGHKAVVELLIETGKVEVDSKDKNDKTPISLAAKKGHEAVFKLLKLFHST